MKGATLKLLQQRTEAVVEGPVSSAPRAASKPLSRAAMWLEFPLAIAIFVVIALNIAHQPILLINALGILLLWAFQAYLKWRYQINLPFSVMFFVLAAIEIDAVGNRYLLYQRLPWPVPYDVFAHFVIPALMSPALVWLILAAVERFGYRLSKGAAAFFAITTNFSLAGFYEIIELWDEVFLGRQRIWSMHDTSRDLQNGLLGAIIGSVITYAVLKLVRRAPVPEPGGRTLRLVHKQS
jgi:uncharacterized membrane protein YjdF